LSLPGLLAAVQRDLADEGVPWALVGGLAVAARTEPRFTADLDLAVAVADDPAAEVLLRRLMERGYEIHSLMEQTASGRLATARLQAPGFEPPVDILFASSGVEAEVVAASDIVEVFPGTRAPVARIPHLVAMKLLARDDARRDQDRGDLRRLLRRCGPAELAQTRTLLDCIRQRGFHRGRDLVASLSRAWKELSGSEPS